MVALSRLATAPVLVLGRAGMDLYADPPGARTEGAERFQACLGGSSANIAVALCRQGLKAGLLTRLSDDAVGRFCLNELDRYGIDRSHVRISGVGTRTSLAVVETRVEDCQSVIYRNAAADLEMGLGDVEAVDWHRWAALVVTGTALAADPSRGATFAALRAARRAGLLLVLDLDYRPYSWSSEAEAAEVCGRAAAMSDLVVGNDVEFRLLAGQMEDGLGTARALATRGVAIVVYKMGEKGAVTFARGAEIRTGVFPARAIKPTGAGDAFLGGLLAGLAAGLSLETSLWRGSAAAAIVVGRVGCAPAMPAAAEIEAFMEVGISPGPD
jgi:5-dehydro-2-deoxygluconokinase